MNYYAILLAFLVLTSSGCGPLLAGTTDPAKVGEIMKTTNAAGCIYTRASARPWASITTIVVGAWGEPRPNLQECWQQLPRENP